MSCNQMESLGSRPLMLSVMPSIPYMEIVHLPKLQEPITLDNINNLPKYEKRKEFKIDDVMFKVGKENEYDFLTHS